MSEDRQQCEAHGAARRAVTRRLHPDLGGDPQQYVAAMAELDRQYAQAPGTGQHLTHDKVHVVTRHRVRSVVGVTTRQAVACVRGALPRGWPGARRYGRL